MKRGKNKRLLSVAFILLLAFQFSGAACAGAARQPANKRHDLRIRFESLKQKMEQEQTHDFDMRAARELVKTGRKAYQQGDYEEAERILSELEAMVSAEEETPPVSDVVIPPPPSEPQLIKTLGDRHFGAHFAPWNVAMLKNLSDIPRVSAIANDMGVDSIRLNVMWEHVEPARGVYDWSLIDRVVQAAGDKDYLFTLYTASSWATPQGKPMPGQKFSRPAYPSNIQDYVDFLNKIVPRYKARVKYWQINNEVYGLGNFWESSPQQYLELLKISSETIKSLDPQAKILPAGIALAAIDVDLAAKALPPKLSKNLQFIDAVFTEGRDSFDILDIHLYYKWDAMPSRLAFFKNRMASFGVRKPIWVTETGGPDLRACLPPKDFQAVTSELSEKRRTGDPVKLEILRSNSCAKIVYFEEYEDERYRMQAQELIKRFVVAFANGADKVFWHKLIPEGDELFWNRMSLTDRLGKRREGFTAYKLTIQKLDGFESVIKLQKETRGEMFEFQKPGGKVYVAWSQEPVTANLDYEKDSATVTDAFGKVTTVKSANGKIAFTLTSTPVFIE